MRRAVALVLLAGLTLTACQTQQVNWRFWERPSSDVPPELMEPGDVPIDPLPPEPGLQLSTEQRFPDVPLPLGAKQDDRTYVYQSSDLRIGRMVYSSRSSVQELANFFIRECPAADWILDSVVQSEGAELRFNKNGERLVVKISELGVARGREFELHLTPVPAK
ncbi:MAG: hypothetical protein GY851_26100 [bacterium]|nr:hypothetical protein [bacterium]